MVAALVCLATAGLCPVADAAPGHALVVDPANDVPYSFEPLPDVTSVEVTWTDVLTVRVTYATHPAGTKIRLVASGAAMDELDAAINACDPDADPSFTVTGDDRGAVLTATEISGQLPTDAVWVGDTVTYSFSSNALTRRYENAPPFACLSGDTGNDEFFGAFDGRVIILTAKVAADGIRQGLRRRYKTVSVASPVRCPARGAVPATDESTQDGPQPAKRYCSFRLPLSSSVIFGWGSVSLRNGSPQSGRLYVRRFPSRTNECGMTGNWQHWTLYPRPATALMGYTSVWTKGVTCRVARKLARTFSIRNFSPRAMVRYQKSRFRCVATTIDPQYRYEDYRCSASRGRTIWYEAGGARAPR